MIFGLCKSVEFDFRNLNRTISGCLIAIKHNFVVKVCSTICFSNVKCHFALSNCSVNCFNNVIEVSVACNVKFDAINC